MPKRNDQLLLQDVHEAGTKILEFTSGYDYDDFINDARTVDAVIRNFEIIGEASKLLSEQIKIEIPDIEWRKMIAFRNLLIHDYFGINHQLVWNIIKDYLPQTMNLIAQLLNKTSK